MRNLKFLLAIGMAFGFTIMLHAAEQVPIHKEDHVKFAIEKHALSMPFITIVDADLSVEKKQFSYNDIFIVNEYRSITSEDLLFSIPDLIPWKFIEYNFIRDISRENRMKCYCPCRSDNEDKTRNRFTSKFKEADSAFNALYKIDS